MQKIPNKKFVLLQQIFKVHLKNLPKIPINTSHINFQMETK